MFDNAFRERTTARTMTALNSDLTDWRDADGGWFDGTVASVDRRIAQASSLLHRLHQAGITGYGAVSELTADRENLGELRISMLNAHSDRVAEHREPTGPRSFSSATLIEARAYVRDNIEAAHVPDEMRERALFWASARMSEAHARQFAAACVEVASTVPRPQPQHTAAMVADFDDHHLFL